MKGKKTYFVAGLMFLYAAIGMALGEMTGAQGVGFILEALAVTGLRIGIASK